MAIFGILRVETVSSVCVPRIMKHCLKLSCIDNFRSNFVSAVLSLLFLGGWEAVYGTAVFNAFSFKKQLSVVFVLFSHCSFLPETLWEQPLELQFSAAGLLPGCSWALSVHLHYLLPAFLLIQKYVV